MSVVPEGLSPSEVGKEIREHATHLGHVELHRHDRLISIAEAVLLAIVALTAAWAGYSAAKWGTESSLKLAKASASGRRRIGRSSWRTRRARRMPRTSMPGIRRIWPEQRAERVAEKRFRPNYDVAFLAWLATKPDVSPPTGTHPSTSTKKNVKAPGPASGSYVSNQQQQLQDKGGQ
jgi:hypothetical protein